MKTIKGKVEFVVIGVHFDNGNDPTHDNGNSMYLSSITEEQAAELVSSVSGYDGEKEYDGFNDYARPSSYVNTAKESLISLLKSNGCWTKDMRYEGSSVDLFLLDEIGHTPQAHLEEKWKIIKEDTEKGVNFSKAKDIKELPDDFLIIKA